MNDIFVLDLGSTNLWYTFGSGQLGMARK